MRFDKIRRGKSSATQEESVASSERPRLTLRHLNKLRKIRELRRLEQAQKRAEVHDMYGKNSDSSDDVKPTMVPRKAH